jgi:hypothetical protein
MSNISLPSNDESHANDFQIELFSTCKKHEPILTVFGGYGFMLERYFNVILLQDNFVSCNGSCTLHP